MCVCVCVCVSMRVRFCIVICAYTSISRLFLQISSSVSSKLTHRAKSLRAYFGARHTATKPVLTTHYKCTHKAHSWHSHTSLMLYCMYLFPLWRQKYQHSVNLKPHKRLINACKHRTFDWDSRRLIRVQSIVMYFSFSRSIEFSVGFSPWQSKDESTRTE